MPEHKIDEVGYWTEIKLNILREYAAAYATIMDKQEVIKHVAYIDGFAGAGSHISRTTGESIEGSPSIALKTEPPFSHYHFIDLDGKRAAYLNQKTEGRYDVSIYEGDCNDILLEKVFPQCKYEDYRRGLCLLDPYDLNPKWEVVQTAGQMRSIEIFLNFMIMDANMNVLWKNPGKVTTEQAKRMSDFWGDASWRNASYRTSPGLFGDDLHEKRTNEEVVEAYRSRLKKIAGFKYVPEPMPMRNTRGAVIYYLFFASQNEKGSKIARDIFVKWKSIGDRGGF